MGIYYILCNELWFHIASFLPPNEEVAFIINQYYLFTCLIHKNAYFSRLFTAFINGLNLDLCSNNITKKLLNYIVCFGGRGATWILEINLNIIPLSMMEPAWFSNMSYYSVNRAAKGGVNLITYLQQNPNIKIKEYDLNLADFGLTGAAEGGHMELAKYFISQGARTFNKALNCAVKGKKKELVEYLIPMSTSVDNGLCRAADNGDLDMIKYLYGVNKRDGEDFADDYIVSLAVRKNRLDILEYMLGVGYTNIDFIVKEAAANGNIELVKYMMQRGELIHFKNVIKSATCCGQFEMLKFLEKELEETKINYVKLLNLIPYYVSIDMFIYLVEKSRASIISYTNLKDFVVEDNIPVLEYVFKYLNNKVDANLLEQAIRYGRLNALKILIKNYKGLLPTLTDAKDLAKLRGYDDVLDYLSGLQ